MDKVGLIVKIIGYVLIGIVVLSAFIAFIALTNVDEGKDFRTGTTFVLDLFKAWWKACQANRVLNYLIKVIISVTAIRAILALSLNIVLPAGDFMWARGEILKKRVYDTLPRRGKEIWKDIELKYRQGRDMRRARRDYRNARAYSAWNTILMSRRSGSGIKDSISNGFSAFRDYGSY